MSRPEPLRLVSVLAAFVAGIGLITLAKGGIFIGAHEADAFHLMDVLFRMQAGLQPHRDFVTPLGIFSLWPMVLFMNLGFGVGTAIMLGQILVAVLLLPAVAYASCSRLPPALAYAFGIGTLWLVLALTYGTSDAGISVSMHYNRWSWSITFIVLALALLPAARQRPALDGALIGAGMAALAMIKMTYFVALTPGVLLAVATVQTRRAVGFALVAGLAVAAAVTVVQGLDFWFAYAADLVNVAGSQIRPNTGVDLNELLIGPPYIGAVIAGVAAIVLLNNAGAAVQSRALALLLPGFIFITYQNSGNDPLWLLLLVVVMLTVRPAPGAKTHWGIDCNLSLTMLAVASFALILPVAVNLAVSPLHNLTAQSADYQPMLPAISGRSDVFVNTVRANTMNADVRLDLPGTIWAKYASKAGREPGLEFQGIAFPQCELAAGSVAWFTEISADLAAAGVPAGSQLFPADNLAAFWLFGPFAPLEKGAPWYYGGLSGVENADYVLIPKCPFVDRHRRIIVDELKEAGTPLTLVRETPDYALFATAQAPKNAPIKR